MTPGTTTRRSAETPAGAGASASWQPGVTTWARASLAAVRRADVGGREHVARELAHGDAAQEGAAAVVGHRVLAREGGERGARAARREQADAVGGVHRA